MNKLLPIILILFTAPCFGENHGHYSWMFYTGEGYLYIAEDERLKEERLQLMYVAGVSDALNHISEKGNWIHECSEDRSIPELRTIFNIWLNENPEFWHMPAAKLYRYAFAKSCGKEDKLPPLKQ